MILVYYEVYFLATNAETKDKGRKRKKSTNIDDLLRSWRSGIFRGMPTAGQARSGEGTQGQTGPYP